MCNLVLDIETIGTTREDVREYIAASIKPPATIKLPASIEKWHKENKSEAIEEAIAKTSFDGAFGQVVCIGYHTECMGLGEVHGLDEPDLLNAFNFALGAIPKSEFFTTVVVGHHVVEFDLRFLIQRYIVNGIPPHPILVRAASAKPWEINKVYDTMVQWAGVGKQVPLDKLCMALGIKSPKCDMDGSMVGQYVKDGRLDEVANYCKNGDVVATLQVYQRMTFQPMVYEPETSPTPTNTTEPLFDADDVVF